MNFYLTTLGTASARPIVDKCQSAHVVNLHGRLFLIDCGEGTQVQMKRFRISKGHLDNILISHLHGDHIFGIFGMLSTMALDGRTAPLYIYAPRDFGSILHFFLSHFGEGIKYEIHHKLQWQTSVFLHPPYLVEAHLQFRNGHHHTEQQQQ